MTEVESRRDQVFVKEINRLKEVNREQEFKLRSVMIKNERLEKENEMLRSKIEENTWNEIDKDDNDER
jgi:hypothetical protein